MLFEQTAKDESFNLKRRGKNFRSAHSNAASRSLADGQPRTRALLHARCAWIGSLNRLCNAPASGLPVVTTPAPPSVEQQ
jgi:hypothetical protein